MELDEVIARSPIRREPGAYHVLRLTPNQPVTTTPYCVVRDAHETTVICREDQLAQFSSQERQGPFVLLQVRICVPFQAPGFLGRIAGTLGQRAISVLMVSTYSFDYVLVASKDEQAALDALRAIGFVIA